MIKKIIHLIIFMGLFVGLTSTIFAFEAKLQLDKSEIDINEYVNLRVEINSSEGGSIGITEIKGLNNFDLIDQSQSQSSSSSIVIMNGKTQNETKTTINLNLTLKAKKKGNYILGPAILDNSKSKIETNSVNIKVVGDTIAIKNQNNSLNSVNKQNNKIEIYDNIEKVNFKNNNSVYLLILVIVISGLGFYFILKKNPKILEKIEINLDKIHNKKVYIVNENKEKSKVTKDNDLESNKEIDFDKIKETIIYPDLNDGAFIDKITEILKEKLSKKYKIENIYNKSFEEILNEINDSNKYNFLIAMVNKSKYSNIISDNIEILDLVKKI